MTRWTTQDIPDLSGRTFLVTGANSGLGYVVSLEVARRGGHVMMTARNAAKGAAAAARIRSMVPGARVDLRHLDLADLDDVRAFAARLLADGTPIDVLINNAGVMMPPRSLTRQGFELQFGVNHLAHFALTGLLLERLSASRDARVVTVSSDLHRRGAIHFDDPSGAKRYGRVAFYAQSKFANVLFGLELDRRLRAAGLPIRSLLVHPGYAATNLQRTGPTGLLNLFMRVGNRFLAQSAEMGALTLLFAATDPAAQSGQFIGPDGRNEKKGYPNDRRADGLGARCGTCRKAVGAFGAPDGGALPVQNAGARRLTDLLLLPSLKRWEQAAVMRRPPRISTVGAGAGRPTFGGQANKGQRR